MERHPVVGWEILRDIDFLGEAKLVVRHHHERWDGRGYPDGLAGEDIPLAARVFSVADVLDALTTTRPYRRPSTLQDARAIIREGAGTQFDPDVVDAFLSLDTAELDHIRTDHRVSARSVLIVDDDPFIRKLVATTLEDVAGFQLHQAGDGLEALETAARVEPALVFLDIDMPRLDGISCCRAMREQDGPGRSATIVMLTAAGGDTVEEEARDAGADLFLTKPFSPLDLLRLVDDLGGT